jgi:hypothetical protein
MDDEIRSILLWGAGGFCFVLLYWFGLFLRRENNRLSLPEFWQRLSDMRAQTKGALTELGVFLVGGTLFELMFAA